MFFAKGVILVEGDAENLLVPTIAEIIGRPLSSYGTTIVNVGSTAFLRYSRIFQRQDESFGQMNIPVAVITDNDIKPDLYKNIKADALTAMNYIGQNPRQDKINRYTDQSVKAFVSPYWTLEYDMAAGCLTKELYKAVLYAKKIEGSDRYGLTEPYASQILIKSEELFRLDILWILKGIFRSAQKQMRVTVQSHYHHMS